MYSQLGSTFHFQIKKVQLHTFLPFFSVLVKVIPLSSRIYMQIKFPVISQETGDSDL